MGAGHIEFLTENSFLAANSQWVELEVEIKRSVSDSANRTLKEAKINSHIMYDSSLAQPASFFPGLSTTVDSTVRENAVGELIFYLINSFSKINDRRFTKNQISVSGMEVGEVLPSQQFKNWLRDLIESRGRTYDTYNNIQEWFNKEPFSYGVIRPVQFKGKADLIIVDSFGHELMVERLGTGVYQILLLLSEIFAKVPEGQARIFGIEELELNLSPHMQKETLKVLSDMASDASSSGFGQLFLTSHSPYLCDRDKCELYAVSLDENTGTSIKHGINAIRALVKHFGYDSLHLERRA